VRRTGHLLALSVLLLALVPGAALAKAKKPKYNPPPAVARVYYDCAHHNSLTGHYPIAVLQQAAAHLPSDAKEYSLCANEIENALQRELAGDRRAPAQTSKQRAKITASEPAKLKQARQLGAAPVNLAGLKIAAGAVTVGGSPLSDLPTPLLILLIALLALASVPLGLRARRLVRARRSR